jgi:predicted nucleic-acid-binding protein
VIFVDTNYFLRFLLADIKDQHRQATLLFKKAARGEVKLFSSVIVFFEIYWVFSSFYGKDKKSLIESLRKVLSLSFVNFAERQILKDAVNLFAVKSVEFEDCFNLVYARKSKAKKIASFDKKLVRLAEEF